VDFIRLGGLNMKLYTDSSGKVLGTTYNDSFGAWTEAEMDMYHDGKEELYLFEVSEDDLIDPKECYSDFYPYYIKEGTKINFYRIK
jgi:hypothetical protein